MLDEFEYGGSAYRRAESGYCYRDGRRVPASEYFEARGRRADELARRIRDYVEEDEDMANVIEKDGVRYVNDYENGRYLADGEEISRAEFMRAMGSEAAAPGRRRARRSRDVALECELPDGRTVTLTSRQAAFLRAALECGDGSPEAGRWPTDALVAAYGGTPIGAGAMISTLREKGLASVSDERTVEGGRALRVRYLHLTDDGMAVLAALRG